MNATLVMFKADGSRRDFPIGKDRLVIGRTNSCDLRIPLSSVSRQHCEITIEDEEIHVRDLGSSNGTYHNEKRIQEAMLSAGDELAIGPIVFTLVVDGEPAEVKPVRSSVARSVQKAPVPRPQAPIPQPQAPTEAVALDEIDDEQLAMDIAEELRSPSSDLDEPTNATEAMTELDLDDTHHDQDEPTLHEARKEQDKKRQG